MPGEFIDDQIKVNGLQHLIEHVNDLIYISDDNDELTAIGVTLLYKATLIFRGMLPEEEYKKVMDEYLSRFEEQLRAPRRKNGTRRIVAQRRKRPDPDPGVEGAGS